jgi:hypothetical protein
MNRVTVLVVVLLASLTAMADEGQHHDLTAQQLGTVHFPISCAAEVQKPFERGVALLHSFWYEEAQKQFEAVARQDPSCAVAYWGQAMYLAPTVEPPRCGHDCHRQ